MRRQVLEPAGRTSVEEVVERLGAVQAQNDFGAQLSINTRRVTPSPTDVAKALADGRIIKNFAFRGAIHLMTPETAGIYLALRASSRMWERPSWRSYYGLQPSDWPTLRATVAEALASGPLTRAELGAAISRERRFHHLAFAFEGDNWTLLKPLAWQGVMCFGPGAGRATFQRLDANPRWRGLPELDDAGMAAIAHYLAAYGPAPAANVHYWLGAGLGVARRRIIGWMTQMGDRLVEIDIDGEPALVLREHMGELLATAEAPIVRLLPGIDQWVMGPGTADAHVTPAARRALISGGANFAIVSGVVAGTWDLKGDLIRVEWFDKKKAPPSAALAAEVERVGRVLGRKIHAGD
jgi:hypothetical protein